MAVPSCVPCVLPCGCVLTQPFGGRLLPVWRCLGAHGVCRPVLRAARNAAWHCVSVLFGVDGWEGAESALFAWRGVTRLMTVIAKSMPAWLAGTYNICFSALFVYQQSCQPAECCLFSTACCAGFLQDNAPALLSHSFVDSVLSMPAPDCLYFIQRHSSGRTVYPYHYCAAAGVVHPTAKGLYC